MDQQPLSILFIEDSVADVKLIKESLKSVIEFSFALDHAMNLGSGLAKLAEQKYDAIILDLGLPDSSGLDTLAAVRAKNEEVPIIILSGNADRSILLDALSKGADNYLLKDRADGNRIAIAVLFAIRNRILHQRQFLADKASSKKG
jgi:DNA-binding response OmpR family regulator